MYVLQWWLLSGGFRGGRGALAGGEMVSAQYLRGGPAGGGNLLAGRPKILGEGGNENLYPPLWLLDVKKCINNKLTP